MGKENTLTERLRRQSGILSWLPFLAAAGLFALGLYALSRLLHDVHLSDVIAALRDTPWSTFALALTCTLASYLCLAGYDWSALNHIGKRLPAPVVLTGGMMAYAFGNTLGLTALSGSAVRWRLYSGLGVDGYEIAAISAFTAVAFGLINTAVGLVAIALQPDVLVGLLALDPGHVRLLASGALVAITVPLIWASVTGQRLRAGRFTLRAPPLRVMALQTLIGVADIGLAALTLYLLLPPMATGFFGFLAIYAAAVMAGVISHVPGGVGVFETIILAAAPEGSAAGEIAAALLLYRLTYYFIPFALSLVFLALHAAAVSHRGRSIRSVSGGIVAAVEPAMRALAPLGPLVLAITTFAAGLWMAISAILPPMTDATAVFFPIAFAEASALLSSAVGSALIVLSLGVVRRSFAAFWLVLAVVGLAAVVTLMQQDATQAAVLALYIVVALPFRRSFSRHSLLTHAVLTPAWSMLVIAALAGLGFTLFFAHKSTPYAYDLWWQFAVDAHAPRALRAGLVAGMTLALSGLFLLLRTPYVRFGPPDAATLSTVGEIAASAEDPDAAFALTGDKSIILADTSRAFVMFGVSGRSWIALGGPVGEPQAAQEVAFDFVDAARRAGADPVFYEVGPEDVPTMLELGMTLHKMGEEAIVDLRTFTLEGSRRKRLRAGYARAQREGLSLRFAAPPHAAALVEEIRDISDQWLAAGKTREKGFSVGRFDPAWLDRWPLALVCRDGRIVAFANVMTTRSRRRATVDLMRHSAAAPSGAMDFLFVALMLELKRQGYSEFTLGIAPLSGLVPRRSRRLWDHFGSLIYRHGGHFYNFAGLRAFKEKFGPDWRPRYLATSSAHLPLVQLADAARLIGKIKNP